MSDPLTNGDDGNGRDAVGRFRPGNTFGKKGSPFVSRVAEWRKALAETVTPEDVVAVVQELVKAAKAGQPWAIALLLDRCLGKCPSFEMLELAGEVERLKTEVRTNGFAQGRL